MRKTLISAVVAAVTLSTGIALAAGHLTGGVKEMSTSAGSILVGKNGMTLYTFDKDMAGKSNCDGGCAKAWPPLMAGDYAKDHEMLTVITRSDGSKQWAYKGAPLYYWQGDKKAGDVTGNNFKNVWHVVKP